MNSRLQDLSILQGPLKETPDTRLISEFEDVTEKHELCTAVIFNDWGEEKKITYNQLNSGANKLARGILSITSQNPAPNDDGDYLVAVQMAHSDGLVKILVAIWKAGAAYLPMDPLFLSGRVEEIVAEAKPVLVICDKIDNPRARNDDRYITFKELELLSRQLSSDNLNSEMRLPRTIDDISIVIYTSGSTGVPKGVRISHMAVASRLHWYWRAFPFSSTEKCIIFKSYVTYVDAIYEVWATLLQGLMMLVVTRDVPRDPELLIKVLTDYKIERLVLVPTLLKTMLLILSSQKELHSLHWLKTFICGGEALSASLISDFYKYFPSTEHILYNLYGSSEAGDCIYFKLDESCKFLTKVPIGTPSENSTVYLLDANLQLVSVGSVGEIYIVGPYLASGYINCKLPSTIVDNPFTDDTSYTKMYRTGDFGRIQDDVILYEGRVDHQIKIRGHKTDLYEIEAAVNVCPGVAKGVVLCYKPHEDEQQVLAFVIPEKGKTLSELRLGDALKLLIGECMMPKIFEVDSIPVLENGKNDRRALLSIYENNDIVDGGTLVKLEIDLEDIPESQKIVAKVLFNIIDDVLGRARRTNCSRHSVFSELGGNSFNLIIIITRLKEHGYFIGITDFLMAKNMGEVLDLIMANAKSNKIDKYINDVY